MKLSEIVLIGVILLITLVPQLVYYTTIKSIESINNTNETLLDFEEFNSTNKTIKPVIIENKTIPVMSIKEACRLYVYESSNSINMNYLKQAYQTYDYFSSYNYSINNRRTFFNYCINSLNVDNCIQACKDVINSYDVCKQIKGIDVNKCVDVVMQLYQWVSYNEKISKKSILDNIKDVYTKGNKKLIYWYYKIDFDEVLKQNG